VTGALLTALSGGRCQGTVRKTYAAFVVFGRLITSEISRRTIGVVISEDLTTLWVKVHPALLEANQISPSSFLSEELFLQVTRSFEAFVHYDPGFNRETPFYDATIALRYRVWGLLSDKGAQEPEASRTADNVSVFFPASHA
jgi:hypothetical protein